MCVQIYYDAKSVIPWVPGTHNQMSTTGMCSGLRGVSAAGKTTSCFVLLYKCFTLKLSGKQIAKMINHADSVVPLPALPVARSSRCISQVVLRLCGRAGSLLAAPRACCLCLALCLCLPCIRGPSSPPPVPPRATWQYIRCIGFLYLRFCCKPDKLWGWYEGFLNDEEELSIKGEK